MQDEQYKITDSAGEEIKPGTPLYNKIVKKIQNDYEEEWMKENPPFSFGQDQEIKIHVGMEASKKLEEVLHKEWLDLSKNMPQSHRIMQIKNVPDGRWFKIKSDYRIWKIGKKKGNEYLIETFDGKGNWVAGAWVYEDTDVLVEEEPEKIYDAKLPIEGTVFPDTEGYQRGDVYTRLGPSEHNPPLQHLKIDIPKLPESELSFEDGPKTVKTVDTDFYLEHLRKTLTDEEIAESYILPNTVTPEQEVEAKRQLGVYRSLTKEEGCPFCDGTGQLCMQVREMNSIPTLQYYFDCNLCHEEWTTNELDDASLENYRAAAGIPLTLYEKRMDQDVRIAELEHTLAEINRAADLIIGECDIAINHTDKGILTNPFQVTTLVKIIKLDIQTYIKDIIDEHNKSKEGQEG